MRVFALLIVVSVRLKIFKMCQETSEYEYYTRNATIKWIKSNDFKIMDYSKATCDNNLVHS